MNITQINKKISILPMMAITMSLSIFPILTEASYEHVDGDDNDEQSIQFTDIATLPSTGINYRRQKSVRDAILDQYKLPGASLPFAQVPLTPGNSRGNPGVALFDYDNDGDLDIYVTNGPGAANSLYANTFSDSGVVSFNDVAVQAGVDLTFQDSAGVCFGDIDNDGDKDLYVTGTGVANQMLENQGDGTFINISSHSLTQAGNLTTVGCSFGDVNNDGLIDLVVANLYNSLDNRLALMVPGFEGLKEHNQLFVNKGQNVFDEVGQLAGIQGFRGASWSIAMVDYDMDGDVDIIVADDQGTRLPESVGGQDFGYIRILQNDGSGNFTDVTEQAGMNIVGDWMGLSFGDLNADGNIDIFASNIGDYLALAVGGSVGLPIGPNEWSSRWFLGHEDGTFTDPGIGTLGTTPFGWGTTIADYNNDGDLDIVFYGGADMGVMVDATNPGTILQNDGKGNFSYDIQALSHSTNHNRRTVHGVASGDLNNDGFIDLVSVSSANWPIESPVFPIVPPELMFGGVFDDAAFIWPTFIPSQDPAQGFLWSGLEAVDGTLSIEMNNANNNNSSFSLKLMGSKGLIEYAQVNRDGIGAVVSLVRKNKKILSMPIVSGGSQASSDSFEKVMATLGEEGTVLEILWPGGTLNRIYTIHEDDELLIPEIPCSFDDENLDKKQYKHCVHDAIKALKKQHVINKKQSKHLYTSAIKAYKDYRRGNH